MNPTTPSAVAAALAASVLALAACGDAANIARPPLQPADTVAPTSSTPTTTYESYGPGPTEWLPLTASITSTVTVGDTITATGTCDPGMVGAVAGITLILFTATAQDPSQWSAGGIAGWTESDASFVQPDGTFSDSIVASVPPGTYYFALSCAAESWMDDALYPDGNGGTIDRYYEYPDSQLRAVMVLAPAPTTTAAGVGVTVPPTK